MEFGELHVAIKDEKVREIWVDDLRKLPPCLKIDGKTISSKFKVEDVSRFFGPCEKEDRIGGTFLHCKNSRLHFGYGMGEFLQLRVSDQYLWAEEKLDLELNLPKK